MAQRRNLVHCPKCGFTFDTSYGRAIACSGCSSIVQCGMARCPKCGLEFPLPRQHGEAYRKYVKSPST